MSFGSGISWSYTQHRQDFWPRINCSQLKLPDFESPSGDSLSKSANFGLSKWIFYVKNHPNLSKKKISLKNINLGAHFLFLLILCNIKIEWLLFLKFLKNLAFLKAIFGHITSLGKKTQDIFLISAIHLGILFY